MASSGIATQLSTRPSRVSLKHELADILNSCAPKDFDPEALDDGNDDNYDDDTGTDGSDMGSDMGAVDRGREHYVAVGKSELRAQIDEQAVSEALGRRYVGKRVKRRDLYVGDDEEKEAIIEEEEEEELPLEMFEETTSEGSSDEEIDSNYAFGESEKENEYTKFKFRGSRATRGVVPKKGGTITGDNSEEENISQRCEGKDMDLSGLEEDDYPSNMEEDGIYSAEGEENEVQDADSDKESNSDSDSIHNSNAARAELRKAMAADTSPTATYTFSAVASTDVKKGSAVRAQQTTFDAFLSGRMKLQPALITANEFALIQEDGEKDTNTSDISDIWKQAETAAIRLWNAIAEMRVDITPSPNPNFKKRKAPHVTTDTPLSDFETHMASLHSYTHPWRARTITKWTTQTHTSSTSATDLLRPQPSNRLDNALSMIPTSTLSGLPSHLDSYLHPPGAPTQISPHLLSRAHIPRKCAPSHSTKGIPNSSEVYDDSDFYELLLRTFLDQRRANCDILNAAQAAQAVTALKANRGPVKMRKKDGVMVKVDVKASKGRRLRYTIHEKLQDFMAPVAEKKLGWWEERQIGELFGSILGQKKVTDQEIDLDRGANSDTDGDFLNEENGLRVFG